MLVIAAVSAVAISLILLFLPPLALNACNTILTVFIPLRATFPVVLARSPRDGLQDQQHLCHHGLPCHWGAAARF